MKGLGARIEAARGKSELELEPVSSFLVEVDLFGGDASSPMVTSVSTDMLESARDDPGVRCEERSWSLEVKTSSKSRERD